MRAVIPASAGDEPSSSGPAHAQRDDVHRRFAVGAFWAIAGAALSRGLTLASSVAISWALGPIRFGELGVTSSTTLLVSNFAALGLGLTATKLVAEHRERDPAQAARVIQFALGAAGALGVISAGALYVAAPGLASRVLAAPDLAFALRVGAIWIPLAALSTIQSGIMAGLEDFKGAAILATVRGILTGVAQLPGALAAGVPGALGAMALAELACVIVTAYVLKRNLEASGVVDKSGRWSCAARSVLGFSVPTFLGGVGMGVALWASRVWLVHGANGYFGVGVFEAANKWALAILFLPSAVASVQLPLLSHSIGQGRIQDYRRIRRANILLVLSAAGIPGLIVAAWSRSVMRLNGEGYESGSTTLTILAVSTVAVALNTTIGQGLVSRGRVWVRLWADGGLAATILSLSWVLIPRYGCAGFAAANAIGYTAVALVLWVVESVALRDDSPRPTERALLL